MSSFITETPLGIQLLAEGLCCLLKSLQPRTLGNKTGQELKRLADEIDRLRRTLKPDETFVLGCPIVPTAETEAVGHLTQGLTCSLSLLEWTDCPSSGTLSNSLERLRKEISRLLR